tara:strand:- start:4982 stop:5767 length:786 start_codon:yes stop_codon:yes gene_type:complete
MSFASACEFITTGFVAHHQQTRELFVANGNEALTCEARSKQTIKERSACWSPAHYSICDPTVTRCNDDVFTMAALVYDVDQGGKQTNIHINNNDECSTHLSMLDTASAIAKYLGMPHMAYETWSSRTDQQRFHFVIPFNDPFPILRRATREREDNYVQLHEYVGYLLGLDYDRRALGMSRAYYLPPTDGFKLFHGLAAGLQDGAWGSLFDPSTPDPLNRLESIGGFDPDDYGRASEDVDIYTQHMLLKQQMIEECKMELTK